MLASSIGKFKASPFFKSIKSHSKPQKPKIFNKKEKKQKIITTGEFNHQSGFNDNLSSMGQKPLDSNAIDRLFNY
jgi:hypothetical protein